MRWLRSPALPRKSMPAVMLTTGMLRSFCSGKVFS